MRRGWLELSMETGLALDEALRQANTPTGRLRRRTVKRISKAALVRQILGEAVKSGRQPAIRFYGKAESRFPFQATDELLERLDQILAVVNGPARLGNLMISRQRFAGALLAEALQEKAAAPTVARRKGSVVGKPTAPRPPSEGLLERLAHDKMMAEELARLEAEQVFYQRCAEWEEAHGKGMIYNAWIRIGWFFQDRR